MGKALSNLPAPVGHTMGGGSPETGGGVGDAALHF